MNIIYISYDGMTDPLGQSQVIPYVIELAKKGYNFNIMSYEKPDRFKQLGESVRRQLDGNSIKWRPFRYHKRFSVLATSYDVFLGFLFLLFFIPIHKIRTLHCRSYIASVFGVLFHKIYSTRFIFDMRGFWADERVEGRIWKGEGVLYRLVKLFEKKMLNSADEIIVLTETAKTIIRRWGYSVNNVSVIPCCTDTDYFRSDTGNPSLLRKRHSLTGKFVFVHTGSLEYWYMKEAMLDYFKIAKEFAPQAHFLILSHSDKREISKLIQDKNLSINDFTMLSVSFADMPKYLAMADAGLIFITPVFSKKASCPTKFAEYLSCCLPVIINNEIGDLEDYVTENNIGVVVRGFNENEYRQTFKRFLALLNDGNLKVRCRQVACDNFSLSSGVNRYYEVYSRLNELHC